MRIKSIERELSHKIQVGEYESIVPTLRMHAELDPSDTTDSAVKALTDFLTKEFNKLVLEELRIIHARRSVVHDNKNPVPEIMDYYKSTLTR